MWAPEEAAVTEHRARRQVEAPSQSSRVVPPDLDSKSSFLANDEAVLESDLQDIPNRLAALWTEHPDSTPAFHHFA